MSRNASTIFRPSYINSLNKWIEKLPGQSWAYYVGFGMILIALQSVITWIEGAMPLGSFLPVQIFLSAAIAFIIAIIPFFDNRALSALDSIKPALMIEEDTFKEF